MSRRKNPVRPLAMQRAELARIQQEVDSALTNRGRSVRDAAERYVAFTGNDKLDLTKVRVRGYPSALVHVGKIDGILYTTNREGQTERYIHKFKRSAKPEFCVSPDGKQIFVIGGAFTFTDRGIVDD